MKRCLGCQKEFKPFKSNQKYCCRKCYDKQYNLRRNQADVRLAALNYRKRNRERLNEEGKAYYRAHREEMIEKAKTNRFKRKQREMLKGYYATIYS